MSHYDGIVGEPRVIPCPVWCAVQDTSEEACYGPEHRVPASRYRREQYDGGEWADAYFTAYASYSRIEPWHHRIHLGRDGLDGLDLTAEEARQLAGALVLAAADLEAATGGRRRPRRAHQVVGGELA